MGVKMADFAKDAIKNFDRPKKIDVPHVRTTPSIASGLNPSVPGGAGKGAPWARKPGVK